MDFVSSFRFSSRRPGEEVIRKYHNRGDAHWNPEGNAFVADYLLTGVRFPIPVKGQSPPRPGKPIRGDPVTRQNIYGLLESVAFGRRSSRP